MRYIINIIKRAFSKKRSSFVKLSEFSSRFTLSLIHIFAVGVATEIPPHNLREVVDAIIHRITYKRSTIEDMRKYILGPDFPTGGVIYKGEGLDSIYETGRGRVEMEALATIESDRTSQRIVITEVPYQSNKSQILRELGAIEQNRNVDGVVEVRDESDRNGIRIVIELKKEANTDVILEYIFSKTRLRAGYNANIVAIADNRPKTLNILDLIDAYISHQVDVITVSYTHLDVYKRQA